MITQGHHQDHLAKRGTRHRARPLHVPVGWLTVTAADLAIWRQYPEAAFTLVELPDIAEDGREQFHLGAFELPLPPLPDEH